MRYSYKHAVLGGTFDHLHQGHKHLLMTAFQQAGKVAIGLSLPHLSHHKRFAQSIQPYDQRREQLATYFKSQGVFDRATILPLSDIYGITLEKNDLDVLLVTDTTAANGELINTERQKRGLPPLAIKHVPFVLGDDGKITSSERIRGGEIDREGHSYLKFFLQKKKYLLPEHVRERLQQPIGTVITEPSTLQPFLAKTDTIITVGDVVSITLQQAGYVPSIKIVDFQTRRHAIDQQTQNQYFPSVTQKLTNHAGTINTSFVSLFLASLQTFHKTNSSQTIVVDGEEDLLALPTMLLAPLDTVVFYGQYNVGMIAVKITEEKKTYSKSLLRQFE